ncbi:MAG: hypothetical protein ACR2PA_14710 [Hyphomicrobiaceae bacterium]
MAERGAKQDGKRGAASRRWSWLTEAFVLKTVFRLLLVATVAFLAFDLRVIYEEANAPLPGRTDDTEPVIMDPPKRRDQLRPYLPLTTPLRRSSKAPRLPGYAKPVSPKKIGARMTFVRGPKGSASAVGRIEPGTSQDFETFIAANGDEIKSLHLHSPGGAVRDALAISKLIREKSIETIVPDDAYCASSCPIVFAGGTKRTAGRRAWVGVHRIYAAASSPGKLSDGLAHGQAISAEVQEHMVAMGVDARAWIHAMKTPSASLYVFTPKQLASYKLATHFVK